MSGHTPGPWKLDLRSGCLAVYPASEDHNCLAEARHWAIHYANGRSIYDDNDNFVRNEIDAEVVANARLISAAPDLYEACKAALEHGWSSEFYNETSKVRNCQCAACRIVLPLLKAAIARAEDKEASQ